MDSDDEIEGGENDVNNDWSAHPHHPLQRNHSLCYRRTRCSEAFMQRTNAHHVLCCAVRCGAVRCGAALLLPMHGT